MLKMQGGQLSAVRRKNRMRTFDIIVDSGANIPHLLQRERGIRVIPYSLTVDGTEQPCFEENVPFEQTAKAFYNKMRAGVDAFPVDEKNVRETLRRVARDHAVIFLTEDYALLLKDFLKRFDEAAYPVVLPVPSGKDTGYGEAFLKSAMERALGVDILFDK